MPWCKIPTCSEYEDCEKHAHNCDACLIYDRELSDIDFPIGSREFNIAYDYLTKQYRASCPNTMKVAHKGNGVHQGLWVGTLTMAPTDGFNEEDMINAMRKIFAQQTVPLKKWAYYREYTKNGTPHIHFCYETETGGRIHKKIFQRYWKLWDEPRNQTGRGGFPGGYHTSAKSETAYLEYMSKDGGRNAFKGFKLENEILQIDK